VNNGGIAGQGILATYPNVNTEEILRVNLLGSIRMARLTLRTLLSARTSGRIINISSIIGTRGYTALAAYSASKAGMDGLTRALAREVGARQIT
jgi:3-oxoacyl-[acyl-carrier protein] reductase